VQQPFVCGRQGGTLFEQVLLLNASYEPLTLINWKRAVKLVCLKKVEVVEESERVVRSVSVAIRVPSVVRLVVFIRYARRDAKFSRRNIYARDKYHCQYCGRRYPPQELTCDHVIPRSRGGWAGWDNLVTCCVECNRKKGHRTPEEAGLNLIRHPSSPSWYWGFQSRFSDRRPPSEWRLYLHLYLGDGEFE